MKNTFDFLGFAPDDRRLNILRHTNAVFPITTFSSREDVERRREELRFNLRMAAGLYPWPEKTPLNVRCEDAAEYDGYTVKKIMFESYPGFWSTGNLYLPRPLPEKSPAILNVIGHWRDQRLTREKTADYPQQLANFARMGFICLVTDMIGWVDNRQVTHEYGGPEKEQWLSSGLGLQLWNNIRALDLLCSMPEVDAANIGMTGASGGGSQTLFLALLDDRIKAAAPINMISLHMQGGCACENAAGLRRDTDNAEMCAMLAPRPLFLAGSTGDWTKYLETAELPAVLEAYRQYGAEDMVEHFYQDAEHQYNEKTRHCVYSFFARRLMGRELNWTEQAVAADDLQALTWFGGERAEAGAAEDDTFFAFHKAERTAACGALSDEDKRRMLRWVTGVTGEPCKCVRISVRQDGGVRTENCILFGTDGRKVPFVRLVPKNWDGRRVCLLLGDEGKACLAQPAAQQLLAEGSAVVSGDLFLTGEYAPAVQAYEKGAAETPFYTTFHYTADACRVQDAAACLRTAADMGGELTQYAAGRTARTAACALALYDGVRSARLEAAFLSAETAGDSGSELSIPGICALGGAKGCLALANCPVETF